MSLITQSLSRSKVFSDALLSSKTSQAGVIILASLALLILVGRLLTPYSPYAVTPNPNSPPSLVHPFGTDFQGHDLLSQVIYGAYPSLSVALLAAIGSVALGFFSGVFSGYFRKLEGGISGTTDAVLTLPILPTIILIAALFEASDLLVAGLLTLLLWAPVARAVTAQVLSVKQLTYVDVARLSGMKDLRIVWRVIIPEVGPIAIGYTIINLAISIVLITALEFLGVGDPNVVSWGSILYWAQQFAFTAGDWWWVLAPGIIIALLAVGLALVGYSVEEALNPRLRRR